jgi:protein TonB
VLVDQALVVQAETTAMNRPAEPAPAQPSTPARYDAAYLRNPAPVYPSTARRFGQQGTVLLRVRVTPDGTPAEVELRESSGSAWLDHAALSAVRQWRFVPATQGGQAVAAWVQVPLTFSLGA